MEKNSALPSSDEGQGSSHLEGWARSGWPMVQVQDPLSKMLGSRSVSDFRFFFRFCSIFIFIMRYLEMGPKSKHKFINASHSSYAHSLKVISDNIFNNFVHETKFPGVELSTCSVVSLSHFSKSFGFWSISHFRIRDVQPGKG
jgi:hypothetical protein